MKDNRELPGHWSEGDVLPRDSELRKEAAAEGIHSAEGAAAALDIAIQQSPPEMRAKIAAIHERIWGEPPAWADGEDV